MNSKKILVAGLITLPFVFASCGSNDKNDKDVTSSTIATTSVSTNKTTTSGGVTSGPVIGNLYSDIIINTSGAKTSFANEQFSTNGLRVYGVSSFANIRLNPSEYSYKLYFNDDEVSGFEATGTYKVAIIYNDVNDTYSKTYNVTYDSTPVEVTYSLEISTSNVKTTFNVEEFNYDNLVVSLKNNVTNTSETINEFSVFLEYEDNLVSEFYESGTYVVNVEYTGTLNATVKLKTYEVNYTAPEYVSTKNEIPLTVLYKSSSSIDVMLYPEDNALLSDFNITLTDDNNPEFNVSIISKNQNINNLSNETTYTIAGYLKENGEYYKIVKKQIDLSVVSDFENVDFSTALLSDAGNMMDIDLNPFFTAAPKGYLLSGFVVYKDDEVVDDIEYDGISKSLYLENLEGLTNYRVSPYYDVANINGKGAKRPPTAGYRIFFYGVTFLTNSAIKYRVRMMYNTECLYTYYVGLNDRLRDDNIYTFTLPIQYEDATIVANPYDVAKVTSNVDLDIKLRFPTDNGPYNVFYVAYEYDNNWSDRYHHVDYEEASHGASLVGSNVKPNDYVKFDNTDRVYYTYHFEYWKMPTAPITADTLVYGYWSRTPYMPKEPAPKIASISFRNVYVDWKGGFTPFVYSSNTKNMKIEIWQGGSLVLSNCKNLSYNTGLTGGTIYDIIASATSTVDGSVVSVSATFTAPLSTLKIAGALTVTPSFNYINVSRSNLVSGHIVVAANKNVTSQDFYDNKLLDITPVTSYDIYYCVNDPLNSAIKYIYNDKYSVTTLPEPHIEVYNIEIITDITYDSLGGGYVESDNNFVVKVCGINLDQFNGYDLCPSQVFYRLESGRYTCYEGYIISQTATEVLYRYNSEWSYCDIIGSNAGQTSGAFVNDDGMGNYYYYDVDFYGVRITTTLNDAWVAGTRVTKNNPYEIILTTAAPYNDDLVNLKRVYTIL